jgi:putative transposase
MALWRLYYHVVWATKDREMLILPEIEQELYGYMIGKACAIGVITHAIGGVGNHAHTIVSIPPRLSVAEFVKEIKGSSSHYANHGAAHKLRQFCWQRGYGVFSLSAKQLDRTVDYVLNQKAHHQQNTLIAALERDQEEDEGPVVWKKGEAIKAIPVIGKDWQE